jgi:predicted lipoprotein with Yx(FWY)xxD motif
MAVAPSSSNSSSSSLSSTINVGTNPKLGNILVGSNGMTLYEFSGDTSGVSNCTAACIETWPPLSVPGGLSPVLGDGVSGDMGTLIRPDGSEQVTLDGAPLYYFSGDKAIGDANGEGFGGKWFAAAPDGTKVKNSALTSPTPVTPNGTPATPAPVTPLATVPPTPPLPSSSSTPPPTASAG